MSVNGGDGKPILTDTHEAAQSPNGAHPADQNSPAPHAHTAGVDAAVANDSDAGSSAVPPRATPKPRRSRTTNVSS